MSGNTVPPEITNDWLAVLREIENKIHMVEDPNFGFRHLIVEDANTLTTNNNGNYHPVTNTRLDLEGIPLQPPTLRRSTNYQP